MGWTYPELLALDADVFAVLDEEMNKPAPEAPAAAGDDDVDIAE